MTNTSQTSYLASPTDENRIPVRSLAYVAEATRDSLYDFIVRKFMESGLTKAALAKRLGKDPSQVTRLLGLPSNWTIDTCAELLFAIDGSMLSVSSYRPLEQRSHNHRGLVCLNFDDAHPTGPATSRRGVYFRAAAAGSETNDVRRAELA